MTLESSPKRAGSTEMMRWWAWYMTGCSLRRRAWNTSSGLMKFAKPARGNCPLTRTRTKSLSSPYSSTHDWICTLFEKLTVRLSTWV